MEIYIITGAPDAKKSSVIRALTGVRDSKQFNVTFKHGVKSVWIETTSPNEISSTKFPKGISPNELIKYLKSKKVDAVIIPLRSSSSKFALPLADVYINKLNGVGFTIHKVIMFNISIAVPMGVSSDLVHNTKNAPANELANYIRKIWEIL